MGYERVSIKNRSEYHFTLQAAAVGRFAMRAASSANDWALSQAALARRAMIASRVSSLAAGSETNAATARRRPSGRVIMPKSLVAEDDWLAPASPGSPHN